MSVTAQSVLKHVSIDILVDPTNKKWVIDQLVRYFNRIERLIATYRPDALMVYKTIPLADGTRQTIPSGYLRLLEVVSNESGTPCSTPVGGTALMDAQLPGWRNSPAADDIAHVFFDPRDPRAFYNWPPAGANSSLNVKLLKDITEIAEPGAGKTYTDVVGNMSLVDDLLALPLADGVCYLAYMKDAHNAAQAARAAAHLQLFEKVLGTQVSSALAEGPRTDNAAQAAPTDSGVVR